MEKPNYYAIIPAGVRYDKTLKANEKLLYGEITCLTEYSGKCFATNEYFAKLYNTNKSTISRWIGNLKKQGYLDVQLVYKKGTKQIDKRYITLLTKSSIPYRQKSQYPIDEKSKDNTTSNNTTSLNNISIRKNEFIFEVLSFDYPEKLLNEFINYWTEPNKSKTKMKFELERTWSTKGRLRTWVNNKKKWEKPNNLKGMSKLDTQINEWQKAKDLL